MAVSSDQVKHIANLAKLKLTPGEIKRFHADLSTILDYVDQLRQVDVSGVTLPGASVQNERVLRRDLIEKSLTVDETLGNAPAVRNGMFSVPKVIDT